MEYSYRRDIVAGIIGKVANYFKCSMDLGNILTCYWYSIFEFIIKRKIVIDGIENIRAWLCLRGKSDGGS